MPQTLKTAISHESLEALIEALGFEDMHNPHEVLRAPVYTEVTDEYRQRMSTSESIPVTTLGASSLILQRSM